MNHNQVKADTIHSLRQSGQTLQEIGNTICLSRERIRQILEERFGSTTVDSGLSTEKASYLLGIDACVFLRLATEYKIQPWVTRQRVKGVYCLWRASDLFQVHKILQQLKARPCQVCGNPVGMPLNKIYCCHDCRKTQDSFRDRYQRWTQEQKATHIQKCRKWQAEHPEQVKVINQRSQAKRRGKWGSVKSAINV